jgi:hypothetical protein
MVMNGSSSKPNQRMDPQLSAMLKNKPYNPMKNTYKMQSKY